MLNIVIPMAGRGSRFANAGYKVPKPMIDVRGYSMIEWVVSNITPACPHRFIFLCLQEHIEQYHLATWLEKIAPGCAVIPVDHVTEGAACTVLLAESLINNEDELMIANSDQYVDFDINAYLNAGEGLDGLIMTMTSDSDKYSFIAFDENGIVTTVREKEVISNEATVGIYNFRHGSDYVRCAHRMIDQDLRVKGEFYVAPVYNMLIEDHKEIGFMNIGSSGNGMYCLGTPDDLNAFLALPNALLERCAPSGAALLALADLSHRYGAKPEYVLAGGGNTSWKSEHALYIKASGTSLATIPPEGFVRMDRALLDAMWHKEYAADTKAREAEVLEDMMAARYPGNEQKRPSVETLLHDLLPFAYVLHVHPCAVNAMTCARDGEQACAKLFPEALWIGSTEPGYILASVCREKVRQYIQARQHAPRLIFLQNHGVFFAADTIAEIDTLAGSVMQSLAEAEKTAPADDSLKEIPVPTALQRLAADPALPVVKGYMSADLVPFLASEKASRAIARSFTPDQVVYCKSEPMYLEAANENVDAWAREKGYAPKVLLVKDLGMIVRGSSEKDAFTVAQVFMDAVRIAIRAENFGGPLPLTEAMTAFIAGWEAEHYRAKIKS